MTESRLTEEGLPVVTEETFMEFLQKYDISSGNNEPEVTERIRRENPQIARLFRLGMENAPNKAARVYYETGVQIAYELLRLQSAKSAKTT